MTQPIDTVQKYFVSARAINNRPIDDEDDRTAIVRLFAVRRETAFPSLRRAAERALIKQGYAFAPCEPEGAA